MTIRSFLPYPDPRLRTPAEPVAAITDEIRQIWEDMGETMYAMPGFGLAAPQIGVMLRLAVVDCSDDRKKLLRMANPEILAAEGARDHEEGSPNLPGVWAKLTRPAKVTVAFMDPAGIRVRETFEGLWATSVQHQIDHLNGKMFIDRLSPVKRRMLVAKSAKKQRKAR